MKVFLDTNILIDLIANREPYSKFAIQIFKSAELKKIKIYTTSHAIVTTHYILKKYIDEKNLRLILSELTDLLNVIEVDSHIIKRALNSKHKDFEDAIQILSANSIDSIDFIVTRNLKDFKNSEIPALSPDEILNYIK